MEEAHLSRVLFVDGESPAAVLRAALVRAGIADVSCANSGRQALAKVAETPFDLAILDVALPDMDGFELAGRLRQRSSEIAILFLSAQDGLADRLLGFGAGCDDFVGTRCEPPELVARVRALLRRTIAREPSRRWDFGRFEVRPDEGRLLVEGRDVAIPARELRLLAFLAANRETLHPWKEIYRAIWDEDPVGTADQNTVSVHIYRLRNRIEPNPSAPRYLTSVRGLGYRLSVPEEGERPARPPSCAKRSVRASHRQRKVGEARDPGQ